MGKLLLLILVGIVAYLLWKGLARNARPGGERPPGADAERMVGCSQCGVHLPISEAVEFEGKFFCSDEHRRIFKR
ncbi:MAG TPA: PP0621 family protein [Burkholderiales bacterium]|nr:PP0621 family protein [Burkholderiales bacterium]